MLDWQDIQKRGIKGIGIGEDEAVAIAQLTNEDDLKQLFTTAGAIRFAHKGNAVNTCGITNARSGRCPEKCNFCSQSAFFKTAAPKYTTKTVDTIVEEASQAFEYGVREFSIVMSGRAINKREDLDTLKDAFGRIRNETGLQTCASLGLMTKEHLAELKEAGMQAMHHNLETARSFHHNIVSTHTYDDEVETIKAAKELGMYVCSGGIFGMGETWDQRIEMMMDLRALDVDSVPVNFLNPRPGTPLEGRNDLEPVDALKIIALIRLVLPTKDILVCGGREVALKDRQDEIFDAGSNGMMLGNYLTTAGQAVERDLKMVAEQGLVVRAPPHLPHPPSVPPEVRSEGVDLGDLKGKTVA